MAFAVETLHLTKHFPGAGGWLPLFSFRASDPFIALQDITLAVEWGEILGILGPNGSGKSTLLRILSTVILPTGGEAIIDGYPLAQEGKVKASVGPVTGEERSFYWRLTGRQNLEFFGALRGLPRVQLGARIGELSEQLGLQEAMDRPFRTYSAGMRQRLALARALLHQPHVLLLDEPTKSLDPKGTEEFYQLIQGWLKSDDRRAALWVTHRLEEAERLCHRIAILHRGRLRAVGRPGELRQLSQVGHRYVLTLSQATEQALRSLSDIPGVAAAALRDGVLTYEASDSRETLPRVLDSLRAWGAKVEAVEKSPPSLAQVYRHLLQEDEENREEDARFPKT